MADLLTAIQRLANKLIPNSTGAKRDTYVKRLAEYSARFAGIAPTSTVEEALPDADWSGTWQEAYDRWLDASDEVLKAAGKPYGRGGEERGSMNREESVALAKKIGVYDELAGLWGPEPGAGTKA